MGWKKILSDVKKKYDQVQETRKQRQHELDEIRGQVDDLLEHFEIPDLEEFLKKYLNKKPEPEVDTDDSGRRRKIPPSRKDYLDFIWNMSPAGR